MHIVTFRSFILTFIKSHFIYDYLLNEIVHRDPNLWLVKCRMGEEKATAVAMMRKFIAYQFTDEVCNQTGLFPTCSSLLIISCMIAMCAQLL